MATESVVNPVMMNRPIVDPKTGSLTQYGYAILSALQIRTGGTVGSVVDVPELEGEIANASHWPIEQPRPVSTSSSAPDPMQPLPHQQALLETYQTAGCGDLAEMIVWHPTEE